MSKRRQRHKVTQVVDNVPAGCEVDPPTNLLAEIFGEDLQEAWAAHKRQRRDGGKPGGAAP